MSKHTKNPTVVNTTHRPPEERVAGRPPIVSAPQECLSDEEQKIELSDLYHPNSKWTPEQKLAAVTQYVLTGSSKRAAAVCDVPASTIRWWKQDASWWPDLVTKVRKEQDDKVSALFAEAREKALNSLVDRITKGDEVLDKDGNINFRAVSARDLATIAGITHDKEALIRGNPTSRTARSESDALDALANKFEQFANTMKESGNLAKPIEGERTDE